MLICMPQMKVFVDLSLNLMINIVFPCILLGELVLSPQLTKTKRGKKSAWPFKTRPED